MNTKRSFYLEKFGIHRFFYRLQVICVSRYRCQRRNFGCFLSRRTGSKKNGQQTDNNTQTNTIPPTIPSGIAKRHQFKASLRTNRITCLDVVPMQRTIPKNSVLCATLLFILLVIINTPTIRTRINNMPATAYTCNIKEFYNSFLFLLNNISP